MPPDMTPLLTPLMICGRYYVDTDANGVVPRYQNVILQYCEGVGVCTADKPPIALGLLPPDVTNKTNAVIRWGPFSWPLFCPEISCERFLGSFLSCLVRYFGRTVEAICP